MQSLETPLRRNKLISLCFATTGNLGSLLEALVAVQR